MRDLAAVAPRDLADQGEPEPAAAEVAGRGLGGPAALEHALAACSAGRPGPLSPTTTRTGRPRRRSRRTATRRSRPAGDGVEGVVDEVAERR